MVLACAAVQISTKIGFSVMMAPIKDKATPQTRQQQTAPKYGVENCGPSYMAPGNATSAIEIPPGQLRGNGNTWSNLRMRFCPGVLVIKQLPCGLYRLFNACNAHLLSDGYFEVRKLGNVDVCKSAVFLYSRISIALVVFLVIFPP
jgi:hypothetical protein